MKVYAVVQRAHVVRQVYKEKLVREDPKVILDFQVEQVGTVRQVHAVILVYKVLKVSPVNLVFLENLDSVVCRAYLALVVRRVIWVGSLLWENFRGK